MITHSIKFVHLIKDTLHRNLLLPCDYLPILGKAEIRKSTSVPPDPQQVPPPSSIPEQNSAASEDEEPSDSLAQHIRPAAFSSLYKII